MQYTEWLDEERGRSQALAKRVGVSKASTTLWRTEGVPMKHMREVSAATAHRVSVREMLEHALICAERRRDSTQVGA